MFFAVYGAAGDATTPLLLLHMHTELEVWGLFQLGADGIMQMGGNKRINLLCIAANGSCLQWISIITVEGSRAPVRCEGS